MRLLFIFIRFPQFIHPIINSIEVNKQAKWVRERERVREKKNAQTKMKTTSTILSAESSKNYASDHTPSS